MDYSILNKILQQPILLKDIEKLTIEQWIIKYPHVAIFRFLLAKKMADDGASDNKSIVRNAAFYIPNRMRLFEFIQNKNNENINPIDIIDNGNIVIENPILEAEKLSENIVTEIEIADTNLAIIEEEIIIEEPILLAEKTDDIIVENPILETEKQSENIVTEIEIAEHNLAIIEEEIIIEEPILLAEKTDDIIVENPILETEKQSENIVTEIEIAEHNLAIIEEEIIIEEPILLAEKTDDIIVENPILETEKQSENIVTEVEKADTNLAIIEEEITVIKKPLDAAEEMLQTLKELQESRKKYTPIWYTENKVDGQKIKEVDDQFAQIKASIEKAEQAKKIEFENLEINTTEENELLITPENKPIEIIEIDLITEIKEEIEEEKMIETLPIIEENTLPQLENNEENNQDKIADVVLLIDKEISNTEQTYTTETTIDIIPVNEKNGIKEVIIPQNDESHSFMEWLTILDGQINVVEINSSTEINEKIISNEAEKIVKDEEDIKKPSKIKQDVPTQRIPKAAPKRNIKTQIKETIIEVTEPKIIIQNTTQNIENQSKNTNYNLDERIIPTKGKLVRDKEVDRMASESVAFNDGLASETLALLYAKQGKKLKAIEVYKILIVKNPKKKRFFASQIKNLESK